MTFYLLFAAVVAALTLSLFWLFWRLHRAGQQPVADLEWALSFSAARYAPMRRLLREADFRFLGLHSRAAESLRAERLRLFRLYLRRVKLDFSKLEAAGKAILIAGAGGPELSNALFQQRLAFTAACFAVEFRLALYRAGLSSVDAGDLLGAVETLRSALRPPAFSPAAA